jgi:hypothetical protein
MNLKFIEDVYQTFTDMRPSIYVLGYLAGIHTVSFGIYLAYKYIKDNETNKTEKDDQPNETNNEQKNEQKNEDDKLPELQMEPIESIIKDKPEEELYSLLTSKRDDLENLITQLGLIQTNIMTIRDKLEELNKSNEQ